jgi:hypothetical protein
MGKSDGNRVVSRTGVDLTDVEVRDETRMRNVSGKIAEEGMGGGQWGAPRRW